MYLGIKCIFDRFFAVLLLLLISPLLIFVYCIVFCKLGSPVLFRQLRPGLYAKPFLLFKFRTMTNDSINGVLLPDKDRLTPFSTWLRATSIDELPGLINILCGDMSFVGPRPLLMKYLPLYTSEQARRHDVKPGFSGWAQINGRNAITWEDKFRMDVWYVENMCLTLDFKIIFITIFKVLLRKGVTPDTGLIMPNFKGSQSSPNSK